MGKSLSTSFTQANGAPAQIAGAAAWQAVSGATPSVSSNELLFSTAGSSNPIYGINVGVRINGKNDVDVSALPKHVYGNAVYVRVVDANNWIRALVQAYTVDNSYYVTEYQHNIYVTEYLWDRKEYRDNYQARTIEYRHSQTTYSGTGFTGWSNTGETTACRIDQPTYGLNSDYTNGVETTKYRWVSNGNGVGCAADKATYRKQSNSQGVSSSTSYQWTSSSTPPSGWTYTGQTQYVSQGTYYKVGSSGSQSTSANGPYDVYVSTTVYYYGTTYWGATAAGPADTKVSPQQSRQTATGTYWDTTYEAGAPTRQTYVPNISYYYGDVLLQKCVAGSITSLGQYTQGSSTPYVLRLRAKGTSLTVYYNGTQRITATDGAHAAGPIIGLGGGASPYNPTIARLDDFSFTILTPCRLRTAGGTWLDCERPKIRNAANTAWIDYDPKGY